MPTFEHFAWYFFSALLIVNGLYIKYYPPKKITWWGNGWKLPFATKTEETWKEANRYGSILAVCFGVITLLLFALLTFIMKIDFGPLTLLYVVIINFGLLTNLTKAHINRLFDESGNRK